MADHSCTKKIKVATKRCGTDDHSNYPEEVWLEIVSRLPMKALMISQCVCRSWRDNVEHIKNRILKDPRSLPTCGIFLQFPPDRLRLIVINLKYMCLQTGVTTDFPRNCPRNDNDDDQRVTVTSGYDKGLLADLSFDLTTLTNCIFTRADCHAHYRARDYAFNVHNGLFVLCRGTYEVINLFTKEVYVLEAEFDTFLESPGIIVTFPTLPSSACEFMVVRFSLWCNTIHVYCFQTRKWESSPFPGDLLSESYRYDHVALVDGLDTFLYFLTHSSVVAIRFSGRSPPKIVDQYVFALPQLEVGQKQGMSKLWICGGNMYFTYYTMDGHVIDIWKHPRDYCSTKADSCAWIPLVNVGNRIKAAVGDCGDFGVQILACNPDVEVIYIRLKYSIFAYDLTRDNLIKITENDTFENSYIHCYLYKPCLSSFKALK